MAASCIDLSSLECPEQLQFWHESVKVTPTGMEFTSYRGLRMYLITGKQYPYFLRNESACGLVGEPKYIYVPDLVEQLEQALQVNLAKHPLLKIKLNAQTEFVWWKYGISPAEEEWVNIVRRVVKRMY